MSSPEQIVAKLEEAFPDSERRPEAAAVEQALRQFWPIRFETWGRVEKLLREKNRSTLSLHIHPWFEANAVVSGEAGAKKEYMIRFLLMDTCTCVLEHLPEAFAHACGDIDPRIRGLLP